MTDPSKNTPPPLVNPKEMMPPLPLPPDNPEVMPLPMEALPEQIRAFVDDVATRQQCPPDYVAIAALCGLSAVVGNKIRVCPKQHDDWGLTPNLWGAVIGGPASSKSPAVGAALAPLKGMERAAWQEYEAEKTEYEAELKLSQIEKKQAEDTAKRLSKKGDKEGAREALRASVGDIEEPTPKRFIVNDSTIEQLGVLMNQNPDGLLLVRDELAGWLSKLEKEEGASDRAFYLECYEGDNSHTTDRIGRAIVRVEKMTLAVIGGIQPSKIAPLIRGAVRGHGNDGFVQRLQLAVWPDIPKSVKWHDVPPNDDIYNAYADCFHRLAAIPREGKRARFDEAGQAMFIDWWEEMQAESRGDDVHPVLSAHLQKMPKTVAALSLIFELIETEETTISEHSLAMALELTDYLKSHAKRLYAIVDNAAIKGAKLMQLRKDKLPSPFTPREVQRKGWTGLTEREQIQDAIDVLEEYNQIKRHYQNDTGGRPSVRFYWVSEG
ncbi:hypothetical protein A8B84_10335 [Marinobacter sp. EhC06]|nr:hypothetical protein A8B80_08540 [Marinobacter sp. EhN04]OAN91951.1 hypothetical protein A8B84_10335 [Marinobacter sp. EhC06]